MAPSVWNRALTPLAKALEHDDMQRLGIDRTSQIARWWNRRRRPLVELRTRAYEERFDVLLGENRWRAIRISGGKLHQIRFVAAYQTKPVSAVTHYAPVASIEPYGEEGKYQLTFAVPAKEIGPIPFADAPQGLMQGPKYTTLARLLAAKKLKDLF